MAFLPISNNKTDSRNNKRRISQFRVRRREPLTGMEARGTTGRMRKIHLECRFVGVNAMKSYKRGLVFAAIMLASVQCRAQAASGNVQQQVAGHLSKAQSYLHEKRVDLAIPELQAAVKLDPQNVAALGNLGVLLYFRGKYADAIPDLQTALKLQPGLARIQMLLGMAEKRQGDLRRAIYDLEQAYPKLTDAHIRLDAGKELVDLYTSTGQMEKAADIVAELKRENPTNEELLYLGYRLYSDLASESLLSLLLVAPDSAQMHAVMGHEDARQGNDAAAIAEYQKALASNPGLPGATFELAELLRRAPDEKERTESIQIFHAALRLNPFDERAACELGDIEFDKGDFTQAREDYARALAIQPSNPYATLGMAKTLIAKNDLSHGMPMLEKAVQLDPTDPMTHYRLALAYRREGRISEAKEQMKDFQDLTKLKQKLQSLYEQMRLQPPHQTDDTIPK